MSTLPTLDVVIPCYNEEGDLATCLDRLLDQADQIEHIIVIDNNSTDDSPAILTRYSQKSDKIIAIHEPRQGVEYARDAGIARAQADVIARIDVDSRVQPGWAQALRQYYGENPDVMAGTGATEYYDLPFRKFTNAMTWFFMTMSNEMIAGSVNMYGANMSIRRQVWPEVAAQLPPRDARVMEDLSISLVLEQKGLGVGYIPAAKALVSGRRIRTAPSEFARYNAQWPNTYKVMGYAKRARLVSVISRLGNLLQACSAYGLQYHNPDTDRFHVMKKIAPYEKRRLP